MFGDFNYQFDGHDNPTSPIADQIFSPMTAFARALNSPSKTFEYSYGFTNDFSDVRYNDTMDPIFNDDIHTSPKKQTIERSIPIPIINTTTTMKIIDLPKPKKQKTHFVMKPFASFDSIELSVKNLNNINTLKV